MHAIRVARADGTRAVDLLRALGLPHDRRRGFAETYGQPSLIPTPSEDRARYVDALAGEIERTLESADGVVNARVHLVLEESAAVLLKARPGTTPISEADVQKLVAGSVAGLDARAVSVVVTAAADPNAAAPASLAALGPLRVTPGTRPLLRGPRVAGAAGDAAVADRAPDRRARARRGREGVSAAGRLTAAPRAAIAARLCPLVSTCRWLRLRRRRAILPSVLSLRCRRRCPRRALSWRRTAWRRSRASGQP